METDFWRIAPDERNKSGRSRSGDGGSMDCDFHAIVVGISVSGHCETNYFLVFK